MADKTDNNSNQPPAPEELKPQSASKPPETENPQESKPDKDGEKLPKPKRRGSYRPSHKATFVALIVVILILLINGGVIGFVLKRQASLSKKVNTGAVSISQAALSKLGVNQTPVKDKGLQLTVNPNAQFNGNVKIAGDATIAGQLTLNNKFSANSASFANLQAGKTSLSQLNVNGDGTLSNLVLRKNLTVAGASQLQGQVTIAGVLTTGSANVTGNLSVGGTLAARSFEASSLTSNTLIIGGHVISRGATPGVGGAGCDAVGNSGNDASGAITIGSRGCGGGTVASLHFTSGYGSVPHVVITPVVLSGSGQLPVFYISSVSPSGFSIGVSGSLPPGNYNIDYIVEQ